MVPPRRTDSIARQLAATQSAARPPAKLKRKKTKAKASPAGDANDVVLVPFDVWMFLEGPAMPFEDQIAPCARWGDVLGNRERWEKATGCKWPVSYGDWVRFFGDMKTDDPLYYLEQAKRGELRLDDAIMAKGGTRVAAEWREASGDDAGQTSDAAPKISAGKLAIVEVIKAADKRLQTDDVVSALEQKNGAASIGTTKNYLSTLMDLGVLNNRKDSRGKGYGLVEWT